MIAFNIYNNADAAAIKLLKYLSVDIEPWCDMTGITDTPTFLINGFSLPQIYNLPDLKHMLY